MAGRFAYSPAHRRAQRIGPPLWHHLDEQAGSGEKAEAGMFVPCDRCRARAAHCWTRGVLALWMCAHHSRVSRDGLTAGGWVCEELTRVATP